MKPAIERIADALEAISEKMGATKILHCYDCKYFAGAEVNTRGFTICTASGMDITGADFCSYGEKVGVDDATD